MHKVRLVDSSRLVSVFSTVNHCEHKLLHLIDGFIID